MSFTHWIDSKGEGDDIELVIEVDFDDDNGYPSDGWGNESQPQVIIESVMRWDSTNLKYVPFALDEDQMFAIIGQALDYYTHPRPWINPCPGIYCGYGASGRNACASNSGQALEGRAHA